MATTQSPATDLTSEEQADTLEIMKEQPVPEQNETSAAHKSSQESTAIVNQGKVAQLSGPYSLAGDFTGHLPTILSPQAQGFYYRGYENPTSEWDEYSSYVNIEGLEIPSPVGYNENPSLVYQTAYGYNPQMPYGPYSPAASPLPSVAGDGQLYSSQQFPFSGASPYYQQGSQQQRSFYGFGSGSNSHSRGYMHSGGRGQGSNYGSRMISNVGMVNQGWIGADNTRGRGRGSDPSLSGSYNGTFDILNEQNRGPRASKSKTQISEELDSSADSKKTNKDSTKEHEEFNNKPEFVTDYDDAKFFIIKSYSEDNVHKSIKYNVWASTSNGNKKLDAAYSEAKDKQEPCPVFLLFSVNASSQFCGVAEMVGPVDFEKSVDYWQQDKWNGQFPVKWHIIKDVPNSQFRHIILENNDNKPVTNSRDTQEVKLEQGIEMLKIFKNYDADTSILDDFGFYEEREKIIQERKARRQPNLASTGIVGESEQNTDSAALPADLVKSMSKSFAQVVGLDEGSKEERTNTSSSDAATTTTVVPSIQPNQ